MKNSKRFLSAVCAVVVAAGMVSAPAGGTYIAEGIRVSASENGYEGYLRTEDGIVYTVQDKEIYVANYEGSEKDLVIPKEIDGKPVTAILSDEDDPVPFRGLDIETLTIEADITRMQDMAFLGCKSLKKVSLPDSLESIGGCGIETPGAAGVFAECSSLTEMNIPKSLKYVGSGFAMGTPWLSEKEKKEQVVIIANTVVSGRQAEGDVTLPSIEGLMISGSAFYGNEKMTSIVVPSTVTAIDPYAFYSCKSLEKVTICNGPNRIGREAFCKCPKLRKLILPPSITNITTKPVSEAAKYRKMTTIYYYKGTYIDEFLNKKSEISYRTAVLPGKTGRLKVTPGKRSAKVSWKSVSTASGYQVQIAVDKSFKTARTANIKGRSKTSRKLTNLSSGKRYFLRQRSYRVVGGKKYYGNYTKTRTFVAK